MWPVLLLLFKLQCLRMKKRQISSLSASVVGLGWQAEPAGDPETLWDGNWGDVLTPGTEEDIQSLL